MLVPAAHELATIVSKEFWVTTSLSLSLHHSKMPTIVSKVIICEITMLHCGTYQLCVYHIIPILGHHFNIVNTDKTKFISNFQFFSFYDTSNIK